jgi:hypothetical protein
MQTYIPKKLEGKMPYAANQSLFFIVALLMPVEFIMFLCVYSNTDAC